MGISVSPAYPLHLSFQPLSDKEKRPIPGRLGWALKPDKTLAGLSPENFARQPCESALLRRLIRIAREVRDHEGQNDSDDATRDGGRNASTLGDIFQSRCSQALLDLIWSDSLVFSGANPGLNLFAETVLLELVEQTVHSPGVLLHYLAERVGDTVVFGGGSAGDRCQCIE
jgi:hypothetical protein